MGAGFHAPQPRWGTPITSHSGRFGLIFVAYMLALSAALGSAVAVKDKGRPQTVWTAQVAQGGGSHLPLGRLMLFTADGEPNEPGALSASASRPQCRRVTTPCVSLHVPLPGAAQLSGHAYNVDPARIKVVVYVLTNEWYVQPLADAPFTDISADGSWTCSIHPWQSILVLLVDPA